MPQDKEQDEKRRIYGGSAERAENNRSSAYTLFFVGILGMLCVILGMMGVLPIRLFGISRYLTYGVMSAMFILFIVMGAVSMKSYRFFAREAESESTIRDAIKKWCDENMDAEELDRLAVFKEDISEEEKYFKRAALIRERIQEKFMNLDEAFLESLVDELYSELYEK